MAGNFEKTEPVLGSANEWDLLNADVVGLKGSLWRGCNSCIMIHGVFPFAKLAPPNKFSPYLRAKHRRGTSIRKVLER